MNAPKIQDYALLGDGRSAALVSRVGSIDWLCWPRFDSDAVFAALLDPLVGGTWQIAPDQPFRTERRYLEGTNVLQSHFHTETGTLALTDLMPVASEEEKRRILVAEHEVMRVLACERGEVAVEMRFDPRPGFGLRPARMIDRGKLGIHVPTQGGVLVLRSEATFRLQSEGGAVARLRMRAGERIGSSLIYTAEGPAVLPALGASCQEAVDRSVAWWRGWLRGCRYQGPYREAVTRSALLLKMLAYAPSGAIVAAPTTSLPERLGGPLNWDYRYCWLRDASFTARALLGLGLESEALAFVSWLIHATRLTRPRLNIFYDVFGERPHEEREAPDLAGYRNSKPVRLGNQAWHQRQLDVYGEVIDAAAQLTRLGHGFDRETEKMLCELGEQVCRSWRKPDEGIWEVRSGRSHHTYSLVLAWTALDRLLALHEKGHLRRAPVERFAAHRERIRCLVEEQAWSEQVQSYTARMGGDEVDASLLLMPWYGFEEASSRRMRRTFARIRAQLGAGDGLFYRYRGDDSAGEGAFGICGFWAAELLALGGGTVRQARKMFEAQLRQANDVGLYAEELDPRSGEALGNFPQGYTHVGLVNAALSIQERMEGRERWPRGVRPKERGCTPEGVRM